MVAGVKMCGCAPDMAARRRARGHLVPQLACGPGGVGQQQSIAQAHRRLPNATRAVFLPPQLLTSIDEVASVNRMRLSWDDFVVEAYGGMNEAKVLQDYLQCNNYIVADSAISWRILLSAPLSFFSLCLTAEPSPCTAWASAHRVS